MDNGRSADLLTTDARMDVDTGFLDAYRRGRNDPPTRQQGSGVDSPATSSPAPDDETAAIPDTEPGASGEPATEPVSSPHADHPAASSPLPHRRSKPGGGTPSDGTIPLPHTALHLAGATRQPHIKSLPDVLVAALREQVRAAAVRELAVPDRDARAFSERLSQGTLVTAFLSAQLDVPLAADPATTRCIQLFRSRDPLLGRAVARLDALEDRERERRSELQRLCRDLRDVRETGAVVEQLAAYLVADRSENFLRGHTPLEDAPLTDQRALLVRDRARDATQAQARRERDRAGRSVP
ncbi:hypothetical protein [Granulicoccus phenolivorans]|uniref:hypothetical protein n=1 Tax=Granulicoccus phenolivorans TaxID=266854 RepID=UPI00047CA92F|nr:hypothetical protein [Granulicoccus phenolivorans]